MDTQEMIKDATLVVEAVMAAVVAQRTNAAHANEAAAAAVTTTVAAAKAAIEAIPGVPAFAKMLLENDAVLTPFVTNIEGMLEKALAAVLDKLEGKAPQA